MAVSGLLVAVGALVGRSSGPEGVTIILNSPEAYAEFLSDHPAG